MVDHICVGEAHDIDRCKDLVWVIDEPQEEVDQHGTKQNTIIVGGVLIGHIALVEPLRGECAKHTSSGLLAECEECNLSVSGKRCPDINQRLTAKQIS